MARIIEVTPEYLRNAATAIEELANQYKSQYEAFYGETNAMASAWQGRDNMAFINQIDGFKDDFTKMYTLMNQYADFLRTTAKSYDAAQESITQKAKKLAN